MTDNDKPNLVALRRRREEVIQLLSDRFGEDVLDVEEFERRVGLAHKAATPADLDELVSDLKELRHGDEDSASEALAPSKSAEELALIEANRPASRTVVAILSGAERKGSWRVPRDTRVFTLLGGATLDFRETDLPPGTTKVHVFALLGGVEIIVPPNLAVECDGVGILGGFEAVDRAPPVPDPDEPLLQVSGVALLGGFEVSTRLPGESARQAKRRRKKELKAKRREQKRLAARNK